MEPLKETGVDLSVIILTYNSADLIVGCINSILQFNDLPECKLEIIIVDNSNAEEGAKLQELLQNEFPAQVLFIKNENKGYGQGNNVGVRAARGRHVLIMNPDVLLIKPIFSRAVNLLHQNSQLALVGGKQLGARNISFYLRPEYEFHLLTTPLMLILNRLNIFSAYLMFPSGAFLFVRKNAFEQISCFDENIFMYCEEADISRRLLEKGYTIKVDYTIPYRHLIDERQNMSDFTFREAFKATAYYFRKFNLSFQRFIWQKKISFTVLSWIFKILVQPAKSKLYKEERERFIQYENVYK